MDTTNTSFFDPSTACTASELAAQLGTPSAPQIIDVRKLPAYAASTHTLPGALWHDPFAVDDWSIHLAPGTSVVVYCVHGHEVSQGVVAALRTKGLQARYLQGGIEHWQTLGMPVVAKLGSH
jgi:rhodanese-related sulfurtransferase